MTDVLVVDVCITIVPFDIDEMTMYTTDPDGNWTVEQYVFSDAFVRSRDHYKSPADGHWGK